MIEVKHIVFSDKSYRYYIFYKTIGKVEDSYEWTLNPITGGHMAAEIVFRDIERTSSLEDYLRAQTEELVGDFFGEGNDPYLKITVYEDRHRDQSRHNHYACDLLLIVRGQHQTFKVSKSSYDLYECVSEAGIALRKQIRRNHKYQISQRRRKPSYRTNDEDVAA